jgi:hypothetical protein
MSYGQKARARARKRNRGCQGLDTADYLILLTSFASVCMSLAWLLQNGGIAP